MALVKELILGNAIKKGTPLHYYAKKLR